MPGTFDESKHPRGAHGKFVTHDQHGIEGVTLDPKRVPNSNDDHEYVAGGPRDGDFAIYRRHKSKSGTKDGWERHASTEEYHKHNLDIPVDADPGEASIIPRSHKNQQWKTIGSEVWVHAGNGWEYYDQASHAAGTTTGEIISEGRKNPKQVARMLEYKDHLKQQGSKGKPSETIHEIPKKAPEPEPNYGEPGSKWDSSGEWKVPAYRDPKRKNRTGSKMSRDAGINTAWGFNATQNSDGSLTVHDVPVFVTCQRGQYEFDEQWLDKALTRAKQAESDGYLPPLHVRHHGRDAVMPAGVFRATGKRSVRFKGGMRPAIMADLIITNPDVVAEVMAKRLPYRSVEIFDVSNPNLDSLALLDHEAPFLELPMLVVREVQAGAEPAMAGVSGETFAMERADRGDGLVCFFKRGTRAHVLMEANATMPDDTKSEPSSSEPAPKKSSKKGEIDVSAVVAAISDGSISIADFAAIKEAMSAAESMAPGAEKEEVGEMPEMPSAPEEPEMTGAAPASAPATAMRRGVDPLEFARVKATADAAQAEIASLKAERAREVDVTTACETLKDRALGADVRDRLVKFHREHGPKAFAAYVDGLSASAPRITPGDDRKAGDFASTRATLLPIALKFQKDGPDAVEKATKFAREWEALYAAGHTRMSQERYVEINMAGGPTAIVK